MTSFLSTPAVNQDALQGTSQILGDSSKLLRGGNTINEVLNWESGFISEASPIANSRISVDDLRRHFSIEDRRSEATKFQTLSAEIEKLEAQAVHQDPDIPFEVLVTRLRKVFYDSFEWKFLIPNATAPSLVTNDSEAKRLKKMQVVMIESGPLKDLRVDVAHILAGLDAIFHPAKFPDPIAAVVDTRNASTWSGDLGSVIAGLIHQFAEKVANSRSLLTVEEVATKIKNESSAADLMGDIQAFALAKYYEELKKKGETVRSFSGLLGKYYQSPDLSLQKIYRVFLTSVLGNEGLSLTDLNAEENRRTIYSFFTKEIAWGASFAKAGHDFVRKRREVGGSFDQVAFGALRKWTALVTSGLGGLPMRVMGRDAEILAILFVDQLRSS